MPPESNNPYLDRYIADLEQRIRSIENTWALITNRLDSITDNLDSKLDRVIEDIGETRKEIVAIQLADVKVGGEINEIKKEAAERASELKTYRKWVLTGLGTILMAAILTVLGLK